VRPQVTVTADLASLLARCGVGGSGAWGGVLSGEAVRRLACDATVTRALVRRHPNGGPGHDGHADAGHATGSGGARHDGHAGEADAGQATTSDGHGRATGGHAAGDGQRHATGHSSVAGHHAGPDGSGTADQDRLAEQLRAAAALLPPPLGAPVEPLELGRATRVVPPRCAAPWRCATAAAPPKAATGPHPGPTPTTCGTGSTAGRPTWTTWCCCAGSTTWPSTKQAGGSSATLAAAGWSWSRRRGASPAATPHPPPEPLNLAHRRRDAPPDRPPAAPRLAAWAAAGRRVTHRRSRPARPLPQPPRDAATSPTDR
jgi:hypothetical protein